MKLRRILAAVLAFAMVITASPFENVRFEAAESTQTISAVDTTYMHWSANMEAITENNIKKLKCNNQGCVRTDMPTIDTLRGDVIEQFNAENNTWNWFAYRISVEEQGTYELGIKINGCASSTCTIPICVDNEVYTLTYTSTNQPQTTEVELSVGEHVVVMFSPMPQTPDASIQGNGTYYPWCNFESVLVDSRLTVVKKEDRELTDADVVECFYSRVEASPNGGTQYATYDPMSNGYCEVSGKDNTLSVNSSVSQQTLEELIGENNSLKYYDKLSLPYVQYVVEAPEDGEYLFRTGFQSGYSADTSTIQDWTLFTVLVNDQVYKVEWNKTATDWYNVTFNVRLQKGMNVIRTTGVLDGTDCDNAQAWLKMDYVLFESPIKFVPATETTVNGGDENYVLSNVFTDNENTLGGLNATTAGPVRTDMPTIDMLPYAADLIERWPFASVKVTAEKDGFYDITVNAGINTAAASFQLGMLVDGTSYSMPFKNVTSAGIDASVYLTAGDHVITFLIPMPENVYDARETNGTYYPWMDYKSITFGTGLTVQDAPTINDIKAHLGATISVGDESLLVNKFEEVLAGSADKIRHNKYASPDRSILTAKNITLENVLDLGYDKLPYIAYEVNVENAGTYEVGAIVKTKAGTTSQMGLIIDGTQVKGIPLAATEKEEFVSTSVELSAGKHTLMLTCAMPKDSTSTVDYPWLDVFELCISNGATIGNIHAQDENITVEMENTTYVSGGTQTPYAGASSGKVVGTKINASEKLAEIWESDGNKLLQIDWGQMNYAEFATTGTAGEHEIQLKVIATCTPDKKIADKEPEVYVYVNGEVYKKQLDAWNTFETVTIKADLVEGINVFKCFAVADDASGDTSIFFDTLYFDTTKLTAVSLEDVAETKTEISFVDTTQVFTHKYPVSEDGTKLADPVAGDMQYRKYYIDALNINQLTYVPYAAVKVAAENAGYYEIEIEANVKTGDAAADRIAMLVDGKVYTLRYKKSGADTLSTMIYLEKGTHMLIFTSPMPQTYDEVKDVVYPTGENADFTELKNLYPWFDMKTLILDEGLSIVDKPGYGDVDFSEVIDSVDTIIDAGDETLVLPDNYNDNDAILDGAARDELKDNRVSLETLLLHGFDKAPYASFKVTAPADGTYDIYALVATDANLTSDQIAFIVDRMQVYAVTVEKKADNQIIRATVELTKGTHSIIFTSPMPFDDEEAQAIPAGDTDNWAGMNSKYRWMNYIRFGIDKDLTLESGNTAPITSGIEAEDSEYVKYHGNYESQIYPGATGNHAVNGKDTATVPGIIDKDALFHDLSKLSFIEFAVDAQSAGTQNITLGVIATNADNYTAGTVPALMVYANGKWQEVLLENWNTFEEVTVSVDLVEGKNIIRCAAEWRDLAGGTRVIFDYIEYDTTALTAVKVVDFATGSTIYNAGDEDNVLSNKYTDNGDSLGGASCSDMRWSKYYIDGLKVTQLPRIPYAALKVNATVAGYYDIGMTAEGDSAALSKQIAVLVDGKAYPLTSGTTMLASVYLEAGVHTLIFTSPMPVDKATADTSSSANETKLYPWFNMDTITLGEGLAVTEKITTEEVMLAEVLRSVDGLISAGDDTIVLPNRYTDNNGVLESADRNPLKNNKVSVETLLEKGFDKAPFASFNVTAKEDGTYDIYALVSVNAALTSKQVVVIVDRTRIVSVPVEAVEGTQMIHASLVLAKGTHNIIFTTPMPQTDAEAQVLLNDGSDNWAGMNNAYPWMNYNYFAIDKDLTVETGIKDSTTTGIETEDSIYIKHTGAYEVQVYPGASSAQAVVGQNISTEVVDTDAIYYDWNKFAGIEFAVKAQSAGAHTITLGMLATHAAASTTATTPKLMVYVNGEWKAATISNWNTFEEVTVTVNLKEGTNVIKCVAVAAEEVAGTRVIFDYIEYDTSVLTTVKVEDFATGSTTYNAGDEDKILTNYYTDKGDSLGDASRNPLKEAKHYIDVLTIDKLSVVPYAAIKVNAEADGFYDISMAAGANTGAKSSQIALLVDGQAFVLSFPLKSETTLSATVYLTQGTHMLIFTSPMPVDSETAAAAGEYDNSAYPWFDMNSFTFSKGLTFAEKPSVAEIDFAEVLSEVDGVINAGDETIVLPNHYTDGGDTLGGTDANGLKDNRVSVETLLLKGFDKAPFASFDVTAQEDGTYDIYVLVQTDAKLTSGQIVVLIDRTQIVTVPVEAVAGNQVLHAQLPLTAGTHNLIFTSPMPATDEEAHAIPDGDSDGWAGMNGAYRWMNYIRFAVDKDLTVETGILDSKTEGIESENSVHVDYTGGYEEIVFPGASTGKVLGGDDVINLASKLAEDADYYDWGQLSYIEMAVDADKAGRYELTFNVIATKVANARTRAVDNTLPRVLVYVNGTLYEGKLKSWDEFEEITIPVTLAKGANVIRVLTVADEIKAGDRVFFDYVEYNRTALADVTVEEVKESQTIVNAGDETKVLFGHYTDKGDTLGSASLGDLQWDKLSLDVLTYDHLYRIPYAAIKVTAEENGYYDVILGLSAYDGDTKSTQIGLLVDAKQLYVLSFEKTKYPDIHASIYLTKGTHTLVFTSPMPADKETAAATEKFDKLAYPWVDMSTITLSDGLKVAGRPTANEIETPFYNRIEAENGDYVLYNNYEKTPEKNDKASGGHVIGGQMRWIFEQTFEELTAWLDAKHNSYIEYAVMAPADGEYNIRLGFLAGAKDESVAKPYIAVIVNGTTHKVQYTKDWLEIEKAEMTVTLKEGLNIIRCTSYTREQEGYDASAWINHDFLDIDKSLTALKRSSVKVEAENSAFVNKFKVQDGEDYEKASGKVLGSADRKYVSGLKMTLDQLTTANLKQVPYASFTVEAPMNGYYAMSLDMSTDGRLSRGTIGMLVDGQMHAVKYARTDKSTAGGRAYILTYLTKGEHVLTFTIPMPADSTVEFNYSYNTANFDSLTLYDGLKLSKTQKAPTTEADYTRFEVEEHVMYNLNSNNGTAAGNAYYKVSQSVAEMFRDGIDGTRTPYAELTIRTSEAGTYTLYMGVSYGMTEGCTKDEAEATFVVDTNGKLQTKTVQATKKSTWSIVPVTVNLEKGTNKVRMTHFGSDSQCGGTTWIDFDYIEVSESTVAKLNFAKTGITLEAEEGIFVGYNTESGEAYHNGQYVGSADYGYVDENDVTFENLKPDDLDEMPHVTYNFEVEKAGTYTLSIGFAAGLYHHLTAEMAEGRTGGFAVIVNGTSKQLVEFELTTASSHLSRNITVDLIEGENEITVTTTLADYIIGHTPRDDEKYRLIWVDHDYMVLSEGLSRGKEPEKYGLEDSDYNHAQITLKTASEENDDNVANDNKKPGGIIGAIGSVGDVIKDITKNTPVPVLVGIIAALSAAVGYFIVLYRKKKTTQKNKEESSK